MFDLVAHYLGVEVKIVRDFFVETSWLELTEYFIVKDCVNSQPSCRDLLLLSNCLNELRNCYFSV